VGRSTNILYEETKAGPRTQSVYKKTSYAFSTLIKIYFPNYFSFKLQMLNGMQFLYSSAYLIFPLLEVNILYPAFIVWCPVSEADSSRYTVSEADSSR
jgi:hypothetical protein